VAAFSRVRSEIIVRESLEPGSLVGGKHGEGFSSKGEDFLTVKDDLILETLEANAAASEFRCNLGVTRLGQRFVVPVGKDRVNAKLVCECRDLVDGARAPDNETTASPLQSEVQFKQRTVDELHPEITLVRQRFENIEVKEKCAKNGMRAPQGFGEGRVVVVAQIASEPDKYGVEH